MQLRKLADDLAAHPFFEGFSDQQMQFLASCAKHEYFPAGMTLFLSGGEANTFYLIREGRVALEQRDPKHKTEIIQTLSAGDVLGWSWLFAPYRWHFGACALTDVRTTSFDATCLRTKSKTDHELGYLFMKRVAAIAIERLQAARLQRLDMYGAS